MHNTMEQLPEDGQFVIVEDSFGRDAVARWSHKFGAWFGPDGDPITIRPTRWRPTPADGSPKFLPAEGQLVIVEDASGDKTVARWSSEIEAWFGADGNPICIRPVNWQPIPTDDAPPPTNAAHPTPKVSVAGSSNIEAFSEGEFVFAGASAGARQLHEPVDAGAELIDDQPTPVRSLSAPARAAPRRHSLPVVAVALVSIVTSAVLTVIVSGGDAAKESRALLAWLQSFGPTSAASQLPVGERELANGQQIGRPANVNVSLKADVDDFASRRREDIRPPDERPEESAAQPTARLDQAPAQKPEGAEPLGREAAATRGVTAPEQGAAAQAKVARAVDDPSAIGDRSALPKPVETAETSKLLERASALLRQGDIGAARLVLAFAHESGSPRAAFMLAETYDPQVLTAWRALGTQADARKARELYAKAYAGGIAEAKARFDALPK
jgi:hypothetical protein